jgi:hypothetical protein
MSKKLFLNLILIFSYIYSLPGIAADKKEGQILFKDFNKDLVVDSIILKTKKMYDVRIDSNFDGKIDYLLHNENNKGYEVYYKNNSVQTLKFVFDFNNGSVNASYRRNGNKFNLEYSKFIAEHKMNNNDDCTEIVTLAKKRDELLKITKYTEQSDLKTNIKELIVESSCKEQSAYKDILTSLNNLIYSNSDKGLNSCFNNQLTKDKTKYNNIELIQIQKAALNLEISQLEWAQDIKENIPFKISCELEKDNTTASFKSKKITGKNDTINLSIVFLNKLNSEKIKNNLAETLNANIGHEILHFAGIADSAEGHQITKKIIGSCYGTRDQNSINAINAPTEALAAVTPDLNIAKPDANLPTNNEATIKSVPSLNTPSPDSNTPSLNPIDGNTSTNVAANNSQGSNINFTPEARAATAAHEYPVTGFPPSLDAAEVTSILPSTADLNSGFNQLLPSITPSPESVERQYGIQSASMMAMANNLAKTFIPTANAQTNEPNAFVPKNTNAALAIGANAPVSSGTVSRLPANQAVNANVKLPSGGSPGSKNTAATARTALEESPTSNLQSGDNNKSLASTSNRGQSASSLSIGNNIRTQNELVAALQKNEKKLDEYLRANPDIERQLQKYELLLVVPNANKYDLRPGYGDTKSKSRIIYDPFTKRITISGALKKPPK